MNTHTNIIIKVLIISFVIAGFLLSSSIKANTDITPDTAVKNLFMAIEREVKTLKHQNRLNKQELTIILNQYLLPEINSAYFAMKALGKNVKQLNEELKVGYIKALEEQLINSYANLLEKYNGESIVIEGAQIADSNKFAQVKLKVLKQNNTTNAIVRLVKTEKNNTWLIYDIVVEGISLLQSKEKELQASIAKIGLAATLEKINVMNSKY